MKHLVLIISRLWPSVSKYWYLLFLPFICFSCYIREPEDGHGYFDGPVDGLKPTYLEKSEAQKIQVLGPVPLKIPGKIFTYGSMLFINEVNSGIHIINNSDPANPIPISFIKIHGNIDIAVKSNILYADNAGDLIALNISDINNIQVVKRIENVFPANNFPNQTGVYFECADPDKGIVVGWEETVLTNITCRR